MTADPARTAIVWLTHFDDPEADEAFARLSAEASRWGQVVEARHAEADHPPSSAGAISLSDADLARVSAIRFRQMREHSTALVPLSGYVDLLHGSAARHLPDFDWFWFIEYDVDFSGCWDTFFREVESSSADVLGANIYPKGRSEGWMHWKRFAHPSGVDPQNFVRAFFPVARLSRRLLDLYSREVGLWDGHYEALYPSIALHFGMSVEDIGGAGPFTPHHRRGRIYSSGTSCALDAGSFRAFPPVGTRYYPQCGARLPRNYLWHPIKTRASHRHHEAMIAEARLKAAAADAETPDRGSPKSFAPTVAEADGRFADLSIALLREEGGLDADWYLNRYPDVAKAGADPYEHYWLHGWRERRDPGLHFSTAWYLHAYPEVAESHVNPFAHYLAIGRQEGRKRGSPDILREEGGLDAEWYLGRYPDLLQAGIDPYEHYWLHGWREGRDPGPHFSSSWYLRANPDVAEKQLNPLGHYLATGRREGRKLSRFADFQSQLAIVGTSPWYWLFSEEIFFPRTHTAPPPADGPFGNPGRRPLIFVGHAASRTGAPLILLRLMQHFAGLPNVELFLFLETGGPLLDDYRHLAHVIVNKENLLHALHQRVIPTLIEALAWRAPIPALCNSAASWMIQVELKEANAHPIVSLVHDNLASYSPRAHRLIHSTADEVVFPSEATRQSAASVYSPFDSSRVIPQGLLQPSFGSSSRTLARARVRQHMGIAPESRLVLGCGMRDFRKGADLFVDVARQVFAASAEDVHFLWLGDALPGAAGDHLRWIDQLRPDQRARIHWVDSVADPEEYFLAADIFVLTSRDDPFPCVVHEAMAAALEIVVFEGSGGAPEAIDDDCGISVPYLNTGAMAAAVVDLLEHPLRHARLGERAERRVRTRYVFSDYATTIIDLVIGEDSQARRAQGRPKVFFSQREWSISGVNSITGELVGELNRRGIDARLLFMSLPETERRFVPDVPQMFLDVGGKPWPRQWRLIEDFLTANAPCILFPGYDYGTSALSPRLPSTVGIVGTLHSNDIEHYGHAGRLGRYWNRILAVSQEIAEKARLNFGGSEPKKIKYIPNFVTSFDAPKRGVGSSSDPIRLIYTGRIVEHPKRMSDLAAIAYRLDRDGTPFCLSFVGEGPDRDALKAELRPLVQGGSVVFLGRRDSRQIEGHLQANDLFLLTSESEGMPIALLEAMAQRCVPLVTALPSGIPALVANAVNGFTFEVGDIDGFCRCIAQLHADRAYVAELSEAAYQHVYRNFSAATVAESYASEIRDVWEEITSGSYVRPPSLIDGPFPGVSIPPRLVKELWS